MNLTRVLAIFEKDLKDFMKNMTIFFMPIIPVLLSIFYSRLGDGEEMPIEMIYLIVGLTFASVTTGCIMMMMAEENEKKTLRGLILSPASMSEVIAGKSLATTLLTFVTLIISLLIMGIGPVLEVQTIIGIIILFLFFLMIGIGIGLFVKTVGMTSAYLMPIMFLFGFTPLVELMGLEEGSIVLKIFSYFPMILLTKMYYDGNWMNLGYLCIWLLLAGLFMYICFKRTMLDD